VAPRRCSSSLPQASGRGRRLAAGDVLSRPHHRRWSKTDRPGTWISALQGRGHLSLNGLPVHRGGDARVSTSAASQAQSSAPARCCRGRGRLDGQRGPTPRQQPLDEPFNGRLGGRADYRRVAANHSRDSVGVSLVFNSTPSMRLGDRRPSRAGPPDSARMRHNLPR